MFKQSYDSTDNVVIEQYKDITAKTLRQSHTLMSKSVVIIERWFSYMINLTKLVQAVISNTNTVGISFYSRDSNQLPVTCLIGRNLKLSPMIASRWSVVILNQVFHHARVSIKERTFDNNDRYQEGGDK